MDAARIRNMEDFAKVSGISRPTLSKYFNDPSSVRASTREKIEAALQRYDYRPNIYAMNQNRRLTKTIGIVVPYLADPFFAEIARSIEQRCIAAGFSPALYSSHGSPELENGILDSLRSLRPAGVLLAPLGRASDRAAVEKFCNDIPTVLFDSKIDGVGKAFVGSDNFQSIALIVEYLWRTGEPPCFVEMHPVNPNANKRRLAYVAAMERLGLAPQVIRLKGETWDFENIGFEGGLDLIGSGRLTTNTVLCSNDRLAIGFLAAACEKGIRVGHHAEAQLRVAGHDDHPFARFTCPRLTTVAQDYEAISNRSVETLFALLDGTIGPELGSDCLFEGKLVMRASA